MNSIQSAIFEEIGLSVRGAQVLLSELKEKLRSGRDVNISQVDLDGLEVALKRATNSIEAWQVGELALHRRPSLKFMHGQPAID